MATPTTAGAVPHAAQQGMMTPDALLAGLTWLTFFIVVFILHKFAWKPILAGLQSREDYVRKSLEDADKIQGQLVEVEATKTGILNQAKAEAAQIVDEARKAARSLAHDIEAKARQNAQDIVNNANAQIEGERQHVREALQRESAQIAVALAGKILKENTDTDKNRRLVDEALKEL